MLFVTDTFLIFFLVTYGVFWYLPVRFRIPFLVGASLFFYASWSIIFTVHFLVLIAINYFVMEIWRDYRKKWLFILLQIGNVANIAVFKYYYFFADFIGALFGFSDLRHPQLAYSHRDIGAEITLPLAISFYTFQIMAYGFDIYRGTYDRRHNLRDVVMFKSFFPQLIAGPIMRSKELLPQIADYAKFAPTSPDSNMTRKGLWLILIGIVKKILVADQLLVVIAPVLSAPTETIALYSPQDIWVAMFSCFVFLYCDFSAYSDLARGFGFLLGFEIPINFRAPLFSYSISEFWRRWHMTFSLWIRDYIFIPLGGNRVSEGRVYFNFIFTFFIGGLWHGASYTFVLWGVYMGVMISLEAFMDKRGIPEWPGTLLPRILRYVVTWIFFVVSLPLFFAPSPEKIGSSSAFDSLHWSLVVIARMFHPAAFFEEAARTLSMPQVVLASIGATVVFSLFEQKPSLFTWLRKYERRLLPILGLVVIFALMEFAGGQKDFFYFQF